MGVCLTDKNQCMRRAQKQLFELVMKFSSLAVLELDFRSNLARCLSSF